MMRVIMKKMRIPFWVFLTIVGCASLGRIYGQRVEAAAGDGAVTDSLDAFAKGMRMSALLWQELGIASSR